jgi:hypothetical protein
MERERRGEGAGREGESGGGMGVGGIIRIFPIMSLSEASSLDLSLFPFCIYDFEWLKVVLYYSISFCMELLKPKWS